MTIHYADSAGPQGTGDASTPANAATLKQCMENDVALAVALAAGDKIWCKTGVEITFDGSVSEFVAPGVTGTVTAMIVVITYTTNIGDGGVTSIRDTNSGATNNCMNMASASYWHVEGLKLINPRRGVTGIINNGCLYRNIEVDSPNGNGFEEGAPTGDPTIYDNCYVHDGTAHGFLSGRRNGRFINCVASNNNSKGFDVGQISYGAILINCLSYKNGAEGFDISGEFMAINSLAYGNISSGWYISSDNTPSLLVNSGSASNGAYGITGIANSAITAVNCALNPTNETNTSGKSTVISINEINEITGDPLFTDTAPAVLGDLSIGALSAWKASGAKLGGDGWSATDTFVDVGVAQREEPAGGGGGMIIHPGMTGNING